MTMEKMWVIISDIIERYPVGVIGSNVTPRFGLGHVVSSYPVSGMQFDPGPVVLVPLTHHFPRPARRISDPSPAQPTSKFLLQSPIDRQRPKSHSSAGSVADEDAEFLDPESSETKGQSLGGRLISTWLETMATYNRVDSRKSKANEQERGKEKGLGTSSPTASLGPPTFKFDRSDISPSPFHKYVASKARLEVDNHHGHHLLEFECPVCRKTFVSLSGLRCESPRIVLRSFNV